MIPFGERTGVCIILIPDELIRQVSVSCAERGLLLVRVRDEIRMTFATYQNVLESAIAYGELNHCTTILFIFHSRRSQGIIY